MSILKIRVPDQAGYAFSVLAAGISMSITLTGSGFPVSEAMGIALIAAAGAAGAACWLPDCKVRTEIVVLVIVIMVRLLTLGFPVHRLPRTQACP